MVHFEPADEVISLSAARRKSAARTAPQPSVPAPAVGRDSDADDDALAPVSYLRGQAGNRFAEAGDGADAGDDAPLGASVGAGAGVGDGAGPEDGDDDEAAAPVFDAAAERAHAEQVLLQRLRGRSLSIAEARTVLSSTDVEDADAEEIIERFIELAYIDESRLSDQILHSHHERKGLGRTGVQAEMRRRGLDHDLILAKLEEMPDDETERAIEVAVKRVGQLGRLDDQTIDRRLNAFLMRKGYPSSIVRVAVKAALDSRGGSSGSSSVRFR
ncbi:RecX family transcriptional regulator [Cryobacterium sp. TMT1-21]|uniref:Regulatory protein RecX n=1 Tax=Cryobacterium shii TaxID=1259235 RepID=A0AAQ2C4Q7_9MICO|nr:MULTISPECIES: regulatory protein RecX [Cryobacterium]TFC43842.1 RecX family transcriptional regulator [Cryobacterium shii]TFC80651.1 RecX family transcriptional regulator [Cryobacterium sp. TmT2-59]TFD14035.1 RecX family transcriptional regulator [Cryobacterium sp. TMT1-21]TFD20300.1 RecX family transcriptional regulator [Cryobacterium sp. TMT4-10]TFD23210.1 RecX family transcriptional regulator [Cryobacterium sp. TMT2-23]